MAKRTAIILAAGKSTRMQSNLPKVLHHVGGVPMLAHVIDACKAVGVEKLIIVVGHGKERVIETFPNDDAITWVEQKEQKGTGHAVIVCEDAMQGVDGAVLVIAGDMPLIRPDALGKILDEIESSGRGVTLATSIFENATGYGRIVRDDEGQLAGIVEHADCTPTQRHIKEVNISYYSFHASRMFETLHKITPDNAKGEYYITDAVRIMLEEGHGAAALPIVDPADAYGVNSRADLAFVNGIMQERIQNHWMANRVTIVDTRTTWIDAYCNIGAETTIYPFSCIRSGASIGEECTIGPFANVTSEDVISAGATVSLPTAGVAR